MSGFIRRNGTTKPFQPDWSPRHAEPGVTDDEQPGTGPTGRDPACHGEAIDAGRSQHAARRHNAAVTTLNPGIPH